MFFLVNFALGTVFFVVDDMTKQNHVCHVLCDKGRKRLVNVCCHTQEINQYQKLSHLLTLPLFSRPGYRLEPIVVSA